MASNAAIGEVQRRRGGFHDRVPADSVGSIVAHEAIVVEPSRAFFRAVEPEAERNNASRAARGRRPYFFSMTIFLRAVMRRTSGTLRSCDSIRMSFSFNRDSRFIDTASGVLAFFTSPNTTS